MEREREIELLQHEVSLRQFNCNIAGIVVMHEICESRSQR